MFWLYLIIAAVILGFGMYKLGLADVSDYDRSGFFWTIAFGALLWPFVLAIVIVGGPFVGLFYLGERKRKKKEESTKNK